MPPNSPTSDGPEHCQHENFHANVEVHRISERDGGPVSEFTADITVVCAGCQLPFRWLGVPIGMSFDHPTTGIDRLTLCAPLEPDSAEAIARLEAKKGPRGFSVRLAGSPMPRITDA